VSHRIQTTEKRFKNATRSGLIVFCTKFEVLGNVMKHSGFLKYITTIETKTIWRELENK